MPDDPTRGGPDAAPQLPRPWEHVPLSDSGDGADEATRAEVMAEAEQRRADLLPLRTTSWDHALAACLDALTEELTDIAQAGGTLPGEIRTVPVVWAWAGDEEEQIPGGQVQVRMRLERTRRRLPGTTRAAHRIVVLEDGEELDDGGPDTGWWEGEAPPPLRVRTTLTEPGRAGVAGYVRDRLVVLWVLVGSLVR